MRAYAIKNLLKTQYQNDLLIALGVNADDYEDQTQTWKAALGAVQALAVPVARPDRIHEYQECNKPEASDVETYNPYKEV